MLALEELEEIAKQAGDIALSYFGSEPKYWHKPDSQGRVCEADLAVNDFLITALKSLAPNACILSEESTDDHKRLASFEVFVIDPIDGTEAFLNGKPYFSISIAYLKQNTPEMAVVYAPALSEIYTAKAGVGSFKNGHPIKARAPLSPPQLLISKASYNRAMINRLGEVELHFIPSIAYRLALIAEGKFDGTLAMRPSWDWDIAAGDLICREAGAVFSSFSGPPSYNQAHPQQNGLVAGGREWVEEVLEIAKDLT